MTGGTVVRGSDCTCNTVSPSNGDSDDILTEREHGIVQQRLAEIHSVSQQNARNFRRAVCIQEWVHSCYSVLQKLGNSATQSLSKGRIITVIWSLSTTP